MVQIIPGEVLTAEKVLSGESDRGKWEMIKISDGKSRGKKMTLFPTTVPSGVTDGGSFTVKAITGVKYTARKYKDQWYDEVNADVDVAPSAFNPALDGLDVDPSEDPFAELSGGGPLPF